jgi:hypothetical protein
MIALAALNTTLDRALAVARQPDKGRDTRLTAHKRTRFAALTPDDFADVSHARVLDTYRFITAHVELPCPMHGTPLTDEQVGQGISDLAIETPKQALWFLVVVVIAAVVLDGCTCPGAHGGGAPNNPGTNPPGGGKP